MSKILGLVGLQRTSLLYDSFPTILFQITIFYYDFFLLFCAEMLETIYLKVKDKRYFVSPNPETGEIEYIINFTTWKDATTAFLTSLENICCVRLIEIMVTILLILTTFYASPVYNILRLALLSLCYISIAFRSISEVHVVRGRLDRILKVYYWVLWIRVGFASLLDSIIRAFANSNSTVFTLEFGEKIILVLEFFLVEYVWSVYFDPDYIAQAEKVIKKKNVRASLVGTCLSYESNEEKLMKYIQGFSQRIGLENDIQKLFGMINM